MAWVGIEADAPGARAGHEISVHTDPGGVVVHVNPIFADAGPVGISEAGLMRAMEAALLGIDVNVHPHGYDSVYIERDGYDTIARNFERRLRHASQRLDAGGGSRGQPDPRRRLDDLARAKKALKDLAEQLDRDFRAFSERAEKRAAGRERARARGVEPNAEARPDAAGPGEPPAARGPPDEEPDGEGGAGGPQTLYQSAVEGEPAPPFYSALTRSVEGFKQLKAPASCRCGR